MDNDLVKVTVAVKMNDIRERLYKQVTVHCLHDQNAYAKDIARGYICGYKTGWSYERLNSRFHFFEDREWGYDPRGGVDLFACIVNMGYLKRTRYKYSGAIEYGGYDILTYLRTWEQYPKIELLSKIGLARLAFRKSVLKKAMKDKNFLRWIIAHTDDIKKSNGNANNILYAYNHNLSVCDVDLIRFYINSKKFEKVVLFDDKVEIHFNRPSHYNLDAEKGYCFCKAGTHHIQYFNATIRVYLLV